MPNAPQQPGMAPAPMPQGEAMPPKHHSHAGMWVLGIVMLVLILALVGVAIYLVQGTSEAEMATGDAQARISELEIDLSDAQSEIEAKDMEIEELSGESVPESKLYQATTFSFEYPGFSVIELLAVDGLEDATIEFLRTQGDLSPDYLISSTVQVDTIYSLSLAADEGTTFQELVDFWPNVLTVDGPVIGPGNYEDVEVGDFNGNRYVKVAEYDEFATQNVRIYIERSSPGEVMLIRYQALEAYPLAEPIVDRILETLQFSE